VKRHAYRAVAISLLTSIAFAGPSKSEIEKQLVGTWHWLLPAPLGKLQFEFRGDHSFECTNHSTDKPFVSSRGSWRIEGEELIINETPVSVSGESPKPPHTTKSIIRAISDDRILFTDLGVIERIK
jgi:hypothetical protein